MQVAQLVTATCAEGPGRRWAIWFQGCPLRCAGCCNPEMLSFSGGEALELAALQESMQLARDQSAVEGITLLGGEPFAHATDALSLATAARGLGLSVMIFSGFTLEQLRARQSSVVDRLLGVTDILVDGPYDRTQPDSTRRWIGSTNQRIHFLSERYRVDDACWRAPNTLELRLDSSGLQVNGFPSQDTKPFWSKKTKG